jgi:hypothetical protein
VIADSDIPATSGHDQDGAGLGGEGPGRQALLTRAVTRILELEPYLERTLSGNLPTA